MLNNVVIMGRLTRDPELRYAPEKGTPIATFTLAIDRKFQKDKTDFIPVVAFNKTAENIANHINKGCRCAVVGRI